MIQIEGFDFSLETGLIFPIILIQNLNNAFNRTAMKNHLINIEVHLIFNISIEIIEHFLFIIILLVINK